jgi:hypothetical protein
MTGVLDLQVVAALIAAAILGAMLFFAGVVAPLVFKHFPEAEAGAFIRRLFPRYYDVLAVASLIASVFVIGALAGVLLAAVAGLFVFARFWLMPKINEARDAGREARFAMLHRASVVVNLVQMGVLVVVLVLTN